MIGNSFKVGIYIRLSRDDGNIESDSIINQRSLLNQYIKENNYNLIDEYVEVLLEQILKIKKQIESLELTNNKLTENLDKNYINMLKGIIDEEQYIRVSENIKTEISNNKKSIDNLKNENSESNKIDKKQIEKYINEFLSLDNPTRELIINLVEKIYIYQDKTIDIIFTFKNVT